MAERMLPTFVVIGAQKSGTSSLHEYLDLHPEISMSRPKEPDFFTGPGWNWERGLAWYETCFPKAAPARGESSTSYTSFPWTQGVPERIHSVIPDAKLVYIVRDPVERMLSQYQHNRTRGVERRPIAEVFSLPRFDQSDYVAKSKYYMQIEQYLRCFEASNLLVITQEDLLGERQATMGRVFRFLGVNDAFASRRFFQVHNPTLDHRLRSALGPQAARVSRVLRNRLPLATASRQRAVERLFARVGEQPTLAPGLREQVADHVRDDVERLRSFTGRRFAEWSV